MMEYLAGLIVTVANDVWTTLLHNWPYLLVSVVVAALVQVFVDAGRLSRWLRRRTWVAVLGAVALGALTPFCSCGTTAIVLGALASAVPWAPIVAFMTSSPLTSPEEFVYSVGLFGLDFSVVYVAAAIVVGLVGGLAAWWLEGRGLLRDQNRMVIPRPASLTTESASSSCDSCQPEPAPAECASCTPTPAAPPSGARLLTVVERPAPAPVRPAKLRQFAVALGQNSRRMAFYFLAFATVGYLAIRLIPTGTLEAWLGAGNPVWSVPLAALIGIPVYLNSEGSLPLVASLLDGGMSPGAGLAFLITGAGTSIGAISGMLIIARWRIVALVVGTLFVTAIATGWLANLWL